MKRLSTLLCGLAAIALTACNDDSNGIDKIENTVLSHSVSVEAYTPSQAATRVEFSQGEGVISLEWATQESFSVIGDSENQTFSKNDEGNIFTGELPAALNGGYYAADPTTDATDATAVPIDFSQQTGELNSAMTFMRAHSTDGLSYEFEHSAALLKVTFTLLPAQAKVKKIVVSTDPDVKLKGSLDLTDGTFTGEETNTITITYSTAKPLSEAYLYFPPMSAEDKSLSFSVETDDGVTYVGDMPATGSKDIEAGKLYSATVALHSVLTFTADTDQMMLVMSKGNTSTIIDAMEYSLDGVTWNKVDDEEFIYFTTGKVMLRGKSQYGTALDYTSNYVTFFFDRISMPVQCTGDIRSLIDWENPTTADTSLARFCHLFEDCVTLATAPKLPATELAESCYYAMFNGCTALTEAPELPATKLKNNCYRTMFYECSALTKAPELPATEMKDYCYRAMFYGCTSLETAPKLASETLATSCYWAMFRGCTSLESAPALPATTLTYGCYGEMFQDCTSLESAPALPATTLTDSCYSGMFRGCTTLTSVPALPAVTLAESCYNAMFAGCTSLNNLSNISPNLEPSLIARTLADYCYQSMFEGCTSLQHSPRLVAKTLVTGCYQQMFKGCSSLNSVEMGATDISATDCLTDWLSGVANSGDIWLQNSITDEIVPANWGRYKYNEWTIGGGA